MSDTLLTLHFDRTSALNNDFRTFSVYTPAPDAESERTELYRVRYPGPLFLLWLSADGGFLVLSPWW